MPELKIPEGSIEYLYADLRADRLLNTQAVSMLITSKTVPGVWVAAQWTGTPSRARSARILLDGTLARGTYSVYARITDIPEAPIISVGQLKIT